MNFFTETEMTNDDPMYVRQLEAARDAAEIEIKALEDELRRIT